MKDKTSGTSSGMVLRKCDEPVSDECDAPMAERSRANDTEDVPQRRTLLRVAAAAVVKRGRAQKNLEK